MGNGPKHGPKGPGFEKVKEAVEYVEKKWGQQLKGGVRKHGYCTRVIGNLSGTSVTHGAVVVVGTITERAWSALLSKMWAFPIEATVGFVVVVGFWSLILGTVTGGHFMRCFFRGLTVPVYVYFFLSMWI